VVLSARNEGCTEQNIDQILPGYLYAFLSSERFGVPMVTGGTYGAIVQHIEPHHIADLPVPRLGAEVEGRVHALVEEAAMLRSKFEEELEGATKDLFETAGLTDLGEISWHEQGRDLGYAVVDVEPLTLRALNYAPRYTEIAGKISAVAHETLGQICANGQLSTGIRFTRIPADPGHGIQLIGQRQIFWSRPEGRWISTRFAPKDVLVQDETVMVAARGTHGEYEVFCQAVLVTGSWLRFAYAENLQRVVSGDPTYPGAYLFAFLRSPAAFRCLRSISMGSKQQEIHPELLRRFPVPACTPADRQRIAERVRRAYRMRGEADEKDAVAYRVIEEAISEAASKAG
jgi:type I restriction enzyme S subunit